MQKDLEVLQVFKVLSCPLPVADSHQRGQLLKKRGGVGVALRGRERGGFFGAHRDVRAGLGFEEHRVGFQADKCTTDPWRLHGRGRDNDSTLSLVWRSAR